MERTDKGSHGEDIKDPLPTTVSPVVPAQAEDDAMSTWTKTVALLGQCRHSFLDYTCSVVTDRPLPAYHAFLLET